MKKYFCILMAICFFSCPAFSEEVVVNGEQSDAKIILKNNAYFLVPLTVVGFAQWDWGDPTFHSTNEGMFDKDSRYGGADKIGHFFSAYSIANLLSRKFQLDGINQNKSAIYGSASSFALSTLIEIGDATSKEQGFSVHDQIMNTFGALASYVLIKNPDLAEKIAFKIDYIPSSNPFKSGGRLLDDYEGTKYIVALRLSGFDFAKNNFWRFVEIQVNYAAPGYVDNEPNKSRNIGVGLALNIGEVIDYFSGNKTNKYVRGFFDYYQPRYTYVDYERDLND